VLRRPIRSARRAIERAVVLGAVLVLGALLVPGRARADLAPREVRLVPGAAREIGRSDSASRDTPAFEAAYGPRAQTSAGIELGLLRLRSTTAMAKALS
jgi:hypothetical protein